MFRCRHRTLLAGVGLLLLPASPVRAQQASQYRDLLLTFRDTLTAVQAAVTEFNQGIRGAESDSVLQRAALVRRRCQAASVPVPEAIARIQEAAREGRTRREAGSLVGALRGLDIALRDCEQGFNDSGPGEWADTLRVWGLFRSKQIEQAIRAYQSAAGRFADAVGVKLEPNPPSNE